VLVVIVAPVGDHDLGFGETGEQLDGQQLITDPRAEALDVGVLPRRPRLDIGAAGAGEPAPVSERVRGQLWPVVTANERRSGSFRGEFSSREIDGDAGAAEVDEGDEGVG
jgi:hypothetical protein